MKFLTKLPLLLVLALAACGGGDPVENTSGDEPQTYVPPVRGTGNLTEKEPDLCGASGYRGLVGQPQSVLSTQTFTRTVRVVEFGGIVTQEYNGYRINVRLGPNGNIAAVDCG